jgi:hypothetical protein
MSNKQLITYLTVLVVVSFILVAFAIIDFSKVEAGNELRVIIDTDFGPDVDDVLAMGCHR